MEVRKNTCANGLAITRQGDMILRGPSRKCRQFWAVVLTAVKGAANKA